MFQINEKNHPRLTKKFVDLFGDTIAIEKQRQLTQLAYSNLLTQHLQCMTQSLPTSKIKHHETELLNRFSVIMGLQDGEDEPVMGLKQRGKGKADQDEHSRQMEDYDEEEQEEEEDEEYSRPLSRKESAQKKRMSFEKTNEKPFFMSTSQQEKSRTTSRSSSIKKQGEASASVSKSEQDATRDLEKISLMIGVPIVTIIFLFSIAPMFQSTVVCSMCPVTSKNPRGHDNNLSSNERRQLERYKDIFNLAKININDIH